MSESPGVIYQHPLSYLLWLEGTALLKGFAGEHDRAFTLARLQEVRALLDAAGDLGHGVEARPISTQQGYAMWAPFYDKPGNALLDLEQSIVREILDGLPVGVALDAACGTGRHAAYLAELGHTVIGVDSSSEMLEVAQAKVPGGAFHQAGLDALPLADASVDLVVCAIALSHVEDIGPVFAEFARVLRPGGDLVVSDSRGVIADIGLPLVRVGPDGGYGYMPVYSRLASDYLAVALPLGFAVLRCEEPRRPSPLIGDDGTDLESGTPSPEHIPGEPPSIWALHPLAIEATNAAWADRPAAIIWHFGLPAGSGT